MHHEEEWINRILFSEAQDPGNKLLLHKATSNWRVTFVYHLYNESITQTEVYVAGRIECDADARLNSKSVVLQGTWDDSLSLAVPVDLDGYVYYVTVF